MENIWQKIVDWLKPSERHRKSQPLPSFIQFKAVTELTQDQHAATTEFIKQLRGPQSDEVRQIFAKPETFHTMGLEGSVAFDQRTGRPVGIGFFGPAIYLFAARNSYSKAMNEHVLPALKKRGIDPTTLANFFHLHVDEKYYNRHIGAALTNHRFSLARRKFTHAISVIKDKNAKSRNIFGKKLEPLTSFSFEGELHHAYLRELR